MTELALIAASAHRDELADFERLMRRYEKQVLVTSLRLLGNLEDAQDASQEVFVRFYRHFRRLEEQDDCAGWLYRVTVNVCRDLRRKQPVAEVTSGDEAIPDSAPDALAQLQQSERQRMLALVLGELPEKERAAIVLRDLEGLPTRDVAAILGSSEATVRSQVSQGRQRIRAAMEKLFGRRK